MTPSVKFFGTNDIVLAVVQGNDIRIAIAPDDHIDGKLCTTHKPEPNLPGLEWIDFIGEDPISAMSVFGDKALDEML